MRWLREFLHPAEKCARLGHSFAAQRRKTLRYPAEWRFHIADDCEEERTVCARCGHVEAAWHVTSREGIDSLSMPSEDWSRLKSAGFLIR